MFTSSNTPSSLTGILGSLVQQTTTLNTAIEDVASAIRTGTGTGTNTGTGTAAATLATQARLNLISLASLPFNMPVYGGVHFRIDNAREFEVGPNPDFSVGNPPAGTTMPIAADQIPYYFNMLLDSFGQELDAIGAYLELDAEGIWLASKTVSAAGRVEILAPSANILASYPNAVSVFPLASAVGTDGAVGSTLLDTMRPLASQARLCLMHTDQASLSFAQGSSFRVRLDGSKTWEPENTLRANLTCTKPSDLYNALKDPVQECLRAMGGDLVCDDCGLWIVSDTYGAKSRVELLPPSDSALADTFAALTPRSASGRDGLVTTFNLADACVGKALAGVASVSIMRPNTTLSIPAGAAFKVVVDDGAFRFSSDITQRAYGPYSTPAAAYSGFFSRYEKALNAIGAGFVLDADSLSIAAKKAGDTHRVELQDISGVTNLLNSTSGSTGTDGLLSPENLDDNLTYAKPARLLGCPRALQGVTLPKGMVFRLRVDGQYEAETKPSEDAITIPDVSAFFTAAMTSFGGLGLPTQTCGLEVDEAGLWIYSRSAGSNSKVEVLPPSAAAIAQGATCSLATYLTQTVATGSDGLLKARELNRYRPYAKPARLCVIPTGSTVTLQNGATFNLSIDNAREFEPEPISNLPSTMTLGPQDAYAPLCAAFQTAIQAIGGDIELDEAGLWFVSKTVGQYSYARLDTPKASGATNIFAALCVDGSEFMPSLSEAYGSDGLTTSDMTVASAPSGSGSAIAANDPWITVGPNGAYSLLSTALDAHQEAGARFYVQGTLPADNHTPRAHSHQHVHFAANTILDLGGNSTSRSSSFSTDWGSEGICYTSEGPLTVRFAAPAVSASAGGNNWYPIVYVAGKNHDFSGMSWKFTTGYTDYNPSGSLLEYLMLMLAECDDSNLGRLYVDLSVCFGYRNLYAFYSRGNTTGSMTLTGSGNRLYLNIANLHNGEGSGLTDGMCEMIGMHLDSGCTGNHYEGVIRNVQRTAGPERCVARAFDISGGVSGNFLRFATTGCSDANSFGSGVDTANTLQLLAY